MRTQCEWAWYWLSGCMYNIYIYSGKHTSMREEIKISPPNLSEGGSLRSPTTKMIPITNSCLALALLAISTVIHFTILLQNFEKKICVDLEMTLKGGTVALYPYHCHLPDLLEMTLKSGIIALDPSVTFQAFRRLTIMCIELATVIL